MNFTFRLIVKPIRLFLILNLALSSFTSPAISAEEAIGLKNFREILASFEAATGVDGKEGLAAQTYKKVYTRLPIRGNIEELSAPMMLGVVELAGAFCMEMIKVQSQLPSFSHKIFNQIQFNKGYSQLTPAIRKQVFFDLGWAFWQRDLMPQEEASFSQTIDEASKGAQDSALINNQILQSLCVQFGTSVVFLTK